MGDAHYRPHSPFTQKHTSCFYVPWGMFCYHLIEPAKEKEKHLVPDKVTLKCKGGAHVQ